MFLEYKIPFHSFVNSINYRIFEDGYVLFKINTFITEIDYNDVLSFMIVNNMEKHSDMIDYWHNKLDYLENEINNKDITSIIDFDYYLGISETLLSFLSKQIVLSEDIYLCHRVFYSLSSLSFYNPLNITFDYYYRDIASYIYITKNYDLLNKILSKRIDNYLYCYFFVRLCFPFYYFYCNEDNGYDEYIDNIQDIFHIYLIKKNVTT